MDTLLAHVRSTHAPEIPEVKLKMVHKLTRSGKYSLIN